MIPTKERMQNTSNNEPEIEHWGTPWPGEAETEENLIAVT